MKSYKSFGRGLVAVVGAVLAGGIGVAQPAAGALVSHFPMNESSGAIVDANGVNTTTPNVAGTGVTYGLPSVPAGTYGAITVSAAQAAGFGTAIDFGVDASNRGNFTITQPAAETTIGSLVTDGPGGAGTVGQFTLMAWINLDSVVGTQRLMGTGLGGGSGWGFGTNLDDLRFTTFGGADNSLANTLPTETWVHIAMTYNNNAWEGFINGESAGTDADAGNFKEETSLDYRIGSSAGGGDQFFGKMDEWKIFNTVLTPAEIQAAAVPEPGTLAAAGLAAAGVLMRRRGRGME